MMNDYVSAWTLKDNCLKLELEGVEFFWLMPVGFQLPTAPRLSLATYLLLSPYGYKVPIIRTASSPGDRVAVAFSGGVDSAAALRLLPDPIPVYTQVANPKGMHKIDNALLAVNEVNGIAVETNSNQLAKLKGRNVGFYGAAGFGVTSVLLAEHLGVSTVTDGNIIEYAYLRSDKGHGTQFVERSYRRTFEAFNAVGMHYGMPCAGLTEVSTTKIAKGYRYAMGCMRGTGGEPCLKCLKCYRKMAISGTPISSNPEAERALAKEWIPVLGSLLWARDHCGLRHERINQVSKDYSWVDTWFSSSLELVPEHLHSYVTERILGYGVRELSDDAGLKNWSAYVPLSQDP